jgi:hypothetical protein
MRRLASGSVENRPVPILRTPQVELADPRAQCRPS